MNPSPTVDHTETRPLQRRHQVALFILVAIAALSAAIWWGKGEADDSYFSGSYFSESGKTKFEIDSGSRRFSFYTSIDGRFLLQTEISPYKIRRVNFPVLGSSRSIEIFGEDNRAGGGSSASLRLTEVSEGLIQLERVRPVGGDLGLFRKQP